ncbi:protein ILITYHIA-like [Salvia miltiorrhiza]|uniref:protein ILITYHIA-like n=1 Tax=Salvia miltiorrhiza TaxID=226208 RepID=UPI0025AB7680|nr:protein ILITYHIA-like [Salvia miltiorrhiza]
MHHWHREKNAVWRRVQKCLQKLGIDLIGLITADVVKLCKGLLGSNGLLNSNHMEQEAALNSLSTLMSIIPGDTYTQFAKHFIDLPDRVAHDALSEVDIQIFL